MTKAELIEALQPYTDEIEIVMLANNLFYEVDSAGYGINSRDDGVVVLIKGAQVLIPRIRLPRASQETSVAQKWDCSHCENDNAPADKACWCCGRPRENTSARPCVWRTGCKHPSVCAARDCCVPGGEQSETAVKSPESPESSETKDVLDHAYVPGPVDDCCVRCNSTRASHSGTVEPYELK